ncbi:hypothetical protein [Polyangium jinanense]|uniref:hypothetical protein n=1 Tax=Polyangium jinanense TaxID=2829994 RepID=UPI002340BF96|nr:hypothetical protein [Polyangium jinanense]MDC3956002.1 hypothetical protein [Polyangium jinanense]MDC3961491.1 hypothetical protein [Polyangium jinanense]
MKPFVPVLCHGFSLAAHVLLLGGAAFFGPRNSYTETRIEEHVPQTRMLLVTAAPGETVTEERGGERKVSGPCDEGTMEAVREDAAPAASAGERAEAVKTDLFGDNLPADMYDPYADTPGITPSSWFGGIGGGTGGKWDHVKVDRGNRLDPAPPAQRRERGEEAATSPAGEPPKTRFCPPSKHGENVVFCRATLATAKTR